MSTNRIFAIIFAIFLIPAVIGLNRVHQHAAARQEAMEQESAKRLADYKKQVEEDKRRAEEARTKRIKEINQAGAEKDPNRVYGEDVSHLPARKSGARKNKQAVPPAPLPHTRPSPPVPPTETALVYTRSKYLPNIDDPLYAGRVKRTPDKKFLIIAPAYNTPNNLVANCPYKEADKANFAHYCILNEVFYLPEATDKYCAWHQRMTLATLNRVKNKADADIRSSQEHVYSAKQYQDRADMIPGIRSVDPAIEAELVRAQAPIRTPPNAKAPHHTLQELDDEHPTPHHPATTQR